MRNWLMLVVFLTLMGCNPRIISYQNPKARYNTFETYRVVSPKIDNNNLGAETETVFKTIRESIDKEMQKRSYVTSSISPDLTLRYEFNSSTRVDVQSQQSPFYPSFQVNSRTIYESFLLLELFDQNNKLVWQGSYDLRQERKESKAIMVVQNAVARIFTSYPYRALSSQPDPSLTIYEKKKKN